jgi:hypothetical protein
VCFAARLRQFDPSALSSCLGLEACARDVAEEANEVGTEGR